MSQIENKKEQNRIIKFCAPTSLKDDLQKMALTRNITISSLLRIIASEYTNQIKEP